MEYRKATEKDADKIGELLSKNFKIPTKEEGKTIFLKESKKSRFFVAEEDDMIIGLVSWDERGLPQHQLARIERIALPLHPQREKIAEELLTLAMQDADKHFKKQKLKLRKMYAMVHSTNQKLIDFYKHMGFMQEAVIKDHFYKGVHEIVLSIFFE